MSQPHEDCSEWHAEGNIVTASSGRAIHSLVHAGQDSIEISIQDLLSLSITFPGSLKLSVVQHALVDR